MIRRALAWTVLLVLLGLSTAEAVDVSPPIASQDVLNVKSYGARGDGATDDTAAIQAAFRAARAIGSNVEIYFPCTPNYYLVTASIDAGGFGNAPPTVRGCGSKNVGAQIHGKFSARGQAILDFSGNEGGQILDLTVEGDAKTTPDYGILLAGALVDGHTRGGASYLQNVQAAGTYKTAAIVVRSSDIDVFNHVIAGCQVPSGAGGVALYVVNGAANPPLYPIASAYRTLSDETGLTIFSSMNGLYSLAGNTTGGRTNRAAWLIDGPSGVVNSVNDAFIFGGITASGIEFIRSGNALNVTGVRHEAGGGSFIKTDGFKNSTVSGNVQMAGTTPLIDTDGANGTGTGTGQIVNSRIQLGASNVGANLLSVSSARNGLVGNVIWLTDGSRITMNPGSLATNNIIFAYDPAKVTLSGGGGNRGNLILSGRGVLFGGEKIGAGTGVGTAISNHLSATAVLDFPSTGAQTSADRTISVPGAVSGDTVVLGVPNAAVLANANFTAWVSAADTVTVRFNNYSARAQRPASGTFRVDVWKH